MTRDTKRRIAEARIELAKQEKKRAYEYRNKLIDADAASGLTLRKIGELWDMHWTRVAAILKR